jgi:hypothetical protein
MEAFQPLVGLREAEHQQFDLQSPTAFVESWVTETVMTKIMAIPQSSSLSVRLRSLNHFPAQVASNLAALLYLHDH